MNFLFAVFPVRECIIVTRSGLVPLVSLSITYLLKVDLELKLDWRRRKAEGWKNASSSDVFATSRRNTEGD